MKNSQRLLDFFAEMLPKDKVIVPTTLERRHPESLREYERVIFYVDHAVAYGDVITCQASARLEGPGYSQQTTYQSMSFHRSMWPPKLEQLQIRLGRRGNVITPDEIVVAPIMDDRTPQWVTV